jgi:hypothetical protein
MNLATTMTPTATRNRLFCSYEELSPNAAVQRRRAAQASAARVHSEKTGLRHARDAITVRCNCLLGAWHIVRLFSLLGATG